MVYTIGFPVVIRQDRDGDVYSVLVCICISIAIRAEVEETTLRIEITLFEI